MDEIVDHAENTLKSRCLKEKSLPKNIERMFAENKPAKEHN